MTQYIETLSPKSLENEPNESNQSSNNESSPHNNSTKETHNSTNYANSSDTTLIYPFYTPGDKLDEINHLIVLNKSIWLQDHQMF